MEGDTQQLSTFLSFEFPFSKIMHKMETQDGKNNTNIIIKKCNKQFIR